MLKSCEIFVLEMLNNERDLIDFTHAYKPATMKMSIEISKKKNPKLHQRERNLKNPN